MNQKLSNKTIKIMKTPESVDISIVNKCNLRCKYCSHFTSAGDTSDDLPKEEWLRFFKELKDCAVMRTTLQGGEPFLRPDLEELINGIKASRMRFSILTNGTLITDKTAAFISSTGRCDTVQVSIDGSIPTTHDSMRGKGSFAQAIRGINYLKKYNINTSVRVTIHKQNINDLENIARFLLEDIGLPGFGTNSASYMGLCRQNAALVQLTTEERSIAMEKMIRLSQIYKGRISATAGPLAEAQMWSEMEDARFQGKKSLPNRGYLTACNGTMKNIGVRSDGTIVPCLLLGHIELGFINKDSIKNIWQNHPEIKSLRERCFIPINSFEYCKDCTYINFCTGNCPALAYNMLGKSDHPSPDACLKRFLENGGRLPEKRLLAEVSN